MNVSKSLRLAMVHKDVSQSELAGKTGLSRPTLSMIAKGKRSISGRSLELICEALDYKASEFIALGEE